MVVITTQQLKQTNLIFVEHEKLTKENIELNKKIDVQKQMINNYQQVDSLRLLKEQQYEKQIVDLNKEIKKKSKSNLRNGILIGGVVGISVTSLLFLLIK